jgi:anti-sigma regulatory factor (Ser/Thr protein kinase)
MLAVIHAAVAERLEFAAMQAAVRQSGRPFDFINLGVFSFRRMAEARELAYGLARACPDPSRAVLGLLELFVNAVEHGNLALRYDDKTRLMLADQWDEEIERRAVDPVYRDRQVTVKLTKNQDEVSFLIQDEGAGFEWEDYLEISTERLFDPHGRGIAMACMSSFDSVQYQGNGNTVLATIKSNSTA